MAYEPTHVAPPEGLPAWPTPDGSQTPAATLDGGLDMQLLERRADWAQIECSNGWKGWVDARRLVEKPGAAASEPSGAAAGVGTGGAAVSGAVTGGAAAEATQANPATEERFDEVKLEPQPAVTEPAPAAQPQPAPQPTAPAWTPPPEGTPYATVPAARKRGGFGVGSILAVIGAAIVAVSLPLNWIRVEFVFSRRSWQVPAKFLYDNTVDPFDRGATVAIPLIVAIALILVGALVGIGVRPLRILTVLGGLLALAVAVVFVAQVQLLVNEAPAGADLTIFDFTTVAPLIAIVGGALATVGGLVALARR